MDANDPIWILHRVAAYRGARRTLGVAGTWSLLFGVIAVMVGSLWTPVDWVFTVLGVALMVTGVWNIQAPRPTGILADAVTLLMVGGYGLIGAILAVIDGLPPSPLRAFLGVLQIVWGVQRLQGFRWFAGVFLELPSEEDAKEVDDAVTAIRTSGTNILTGTIELTGGARKRPWKARLAGDYAVFVEMAGPGLLVGTRQTVRIVSREPGAPGATLHAQLLVNDTKLPITLSNEALRFYEQWKAAAGETVRLAPDQAQHKVAA